MAGKTTEEIFGDKLEGAKIFEANTLASMVLIGDGKGGYKPEQLPMEMQLAPIFAWYKWDEGILYGGGFNGVTPYEGRYDAMDLGIWTYHDRVRPYPFFDRNNLFGEVRDIKMIKNGHLSGMHIVARNNKPLQIIKAMSCGMGIQFY